MATITLREQLLDCVIQETHTDCIMRVKITEKTYKIFKLHKIMLMKSSPVFERMFETNMSEGISGTVDIEDIEPYIMDLVIKHVYGCKLNNKVTREDIRDLIIVADKYQIDTLMQDCVEYTLQNLMSFTNILFLLNSLIVYCSNCVNVKEFNKIENTAECISGDDKLEISEDVLFLLVKLDKNNLKSELDLIDFVDRWAVHKINKQEDDIQIRKLLETNILPSIRFLSLNKEEYFEFLCNYNWLSRLEKKEIAECITSGIITNSYPVYLSKMKLRRTLTTGSFYSPTLNDIFTQPMIRSITMEDQIWKMYEQELHTDLIININFQDEPTKIFKLHKIIFMKSSPVFERMVETDISEGGTGQINIEYIEPRIMELVIQHIYFRKLHNKLTREDIQDLLKVAGNYEIITLVEECAEFINNYLMDPNNILFFLNFRLRPYFLNPGSIKAIALEKELFKALQERTEQCIMGDDKLEISENVLYMILRLDKFHLKSEFDLIKFVNRWAVCQIKKTDENEVRKLIEPRILPLLRFFTLSKDEFLQFLCISNWLTNEEKQHIYKFLTDGKIVYNLSSKLSKNKHNRCKY